MLISLKVVNFAIVKELELDFSKGMTAFTGETGAGKSIMIDALMLALGERALPSVVRLGQEKCEVTATFQFEKQSEPDNWLHLHDIHETEGEVILRRQVYAEGRSKSTINGQPFPLHKVKELAERLVHIHGQHEHQTLLQHQTHRLQLDHYARHQDLVQAVETQYKICQDLKSALAKLTSQDKSEDKLAFYEFQLDELETFHLQDNEIDELHQEHQMLHYAKDYLEDAHLALTKLSGEEGLSTFASIHQSLQALNRLPNENPSIKAAEELLNSALIHCEEAEDAIRRFLSQVQLDPERLTLVEERLAAAHQLARKYHIDVKKLPSYTQELKEKIENLKGQDEKIARIQKEYELACLCYEKHALALRHSRQQQANNMSQDISAIIQQLGMPKGYIELQITPLESMQPHGLDKVEYQVCTNPGMAKNALHKIASGGELSRISLAIQMISAERGATPTLIFDEVDVGIGGITAAKVGQLLRKLGNRLQVFCVTHQPQVAANAHEHFVVEKYSEDNETYSRIIPLKIEDKVNEIARMLSGLSITEQTKSHAKELLMETGAYHG